jgi:8-oxo-dGTP diphosphatase
MVCVAVGIVVRDNRVLICQRRKNSRYGLKWEFPGGKVKPRETPQECLVRELREELNINAEIERLFFGASNTPILMKPRLKSFSFW